MNQEPIKRTQWVTALSALPAEQVVSLCTELSEGWKIRPKSIPQSGLGLLKLNDSALNDPFYLGEIPISSAWIEVTTAEGQQTEGAAQLMDDRLELVEALALCDAILATQLPGWEKIEAMVKQGLQLREVIKIERKRLLAHTQVNFSLLDDVGDDNADT